MGFFGLFKSKAEKRKEGILKGVPSKLLTKIVQMKGWKDRDDYDSVKDMIIDKMGASEIERYLRAGQAQMGKDILRVSERNLKKVIESWKPGEYQNEKAYERDLQEYLYKKFGREHVRTQAGEFNADIVVDDTYPIELKYNFDYADSMRIGAQLDKYWREYKSSIFFVVCGIKTGDNGWHDYKKLVYPKFKKKMYEIVKFEKELG